VVSVVGDRDEYVAPTRLPLGPGTLTRRINLEPVILLGGGRALLLQVAHPLVAAGVADHSDYRRDPWGRLVRTLETMSVLAFGPPAASKRQTARLARVHQGVVGESADGVPYRAADPALLVWVWATLVDTALVVFERCYGRLSDLERQRYYQEQKLVARACGIPARACPPSFAAFQAYLHHMVEAELRVTPEARSIAASVLAPPLPGPLGPLAALPARLVTAALLPPAVREQYGFSWGATERWLTAMGMVTTSVTFRVAPRSVRRLQSLAVLGGSSLLGPVRRRAA
jgi:uncharacterized protein (DUF2236 family)